MSPPLRFVLALLLPAAAVVADAPARFRIEAPSVALDGVAVQEVAVTALGDDGSPDSAFAGPVSVTGVVVEVGGEPIDLPHEWDAGRLVFASDSGTRTTIRLTGDVVVEHDGRTVTHEVTVVPGWLSLLPPLVAVALAIWLRQVLAALLVGVFAGAMVLALGDPVAATTSTLGDFVLQAIVDPDGGAYSHMHVILFTTFLGSTVAVMAASGGTHALVGLLRPFLSTRERTQLGTAGLGTVVFFDDYANTLLVGTTMRPVTDGRRISREKLAFLVDATAAPIAGLAIVSTWVGFEIGLIKESLAAIGSEADAYGVFLATLPYRFYPLLLLLFVGAIAWSGRDFGPMHAAEDRAVTTGAISRPGANVPEEPEDPTARPDAPPPRLVNALLPLAFLLAAIAFGLWWTGSTSLAAANAKLPEAERRPATLIAVLENADSYTVLLYGSFLASVLAVTCAVLTRALPLNEATNAWVEGVKQMLPAVIVLVLAWSLAATCNADHLNTAGYLVATTSGWVSAAWMPTLAFLLAAGVSFATGTSWGTMGLLIPLFIPYTHELLGGGEAGDALDPLMLGTTGAVLAGAIFGDHCSPISDTTVLSSAASGCDHLDHVATQMPYALAVGGVSIATCSLPLALGVPPWVGLLAGALAILVIVRFVGRPVAARGDE